MGSTSITRADAPTTQPQSPLAPDAKPVKVGDGYSWTEGCCSDAQGNVFFVDQPNDRIMKWSAADGSVSQFMHPSGYANGMCFDAAGNLIACADEKNELWSIAPDKSVTVLLKDYRGKYLNGPNDVWIRPDGGMYLTDPLYPRSWWKHRTAKSQMDGNYVFFLSPDHKTLTPVVTDLKTPNGIIGTADGKTLFVADISRGGKTWSYTINADGSLSDKKVFCNVGSDGMTIDNEGYIYITGPAMRVFDKNGTQVYQFPGRCGNVCFGGKDGHTLFLAANHEIYTIQMRTHGVGSQ